jgi:chromosome segregation ATPase
MSKFKDASDNIKRLAVIFQGLVDLGSELEKVDSLENHVKELEVSKGLLISEIAGLGKSKVQADLEIKKKYELAESLMKKASDHEHNCGKQLASKKEAFEKECKIKEDEFKANYIKLMKDAESNLQMINAEVEKAKVELADKSAKLAEVNQALDKIKGGI